MPLALQAKMLRAIEERRFERVGGNTPLQVDVRVVAATNRQLRQMVAAKRFREDLFFRLSVFPIVVPPLRERVTDIPVLAQHFIERFGRDLNKRVHLSPSAVERLCGYAWPGNVRELQNCLERAVILAEGDTIQPMHLQLQTISERAATEDTARDIVTALAGNPYATFDWNGPLADVSRRALAEAEKHRIRLALDEAGGDRVRAADALQVPLRFLQAKVKDFGL
jgi:transcriptional regulator with GAF, ATPase, and Fis domain